MLNSFDNRINMKAQMKDLKCLYITDYLQKIDYHIDNIDNMSVKDLARKLNIVDKFNDSYKSINVGLLFFNNKPDYFFPYAQIELVNIPDPTGQGMEERIYKGPIDIQIISALDYIKNNIIAERVFKIENQAKAIRVKNYSYIAIKEFLINALYHKSYQISEPITIRIEKEFIEIISVPGPSESILTEDIMNYNMKSNDCRNSRIGDFLKQLHLIEARNTGIPTALKAIQNNGSPLPTFLTDEARSFFSVIIPIHPAFIDKTDRN